jgi:catalase
MLSVHIIRHLNGDPVPADDARAAQVPHRQYRGGLSRTPRHIQERQLEHFYKADPAYGKGAAKALGIPVKELAAAK